MFYLFMKSIIKLKVSVVARTASVGLGLAYFLAYLRPHTFLNTGGSVFVIMLVDETLMRLAAINL